MMQLRRRLMPIAKKRKKNLINATGVVVGQASNENIGFDIPSQLTEGKTYTLSMDISQDYTSSVWIACFCYPSRGAWKAPIVTPPISAAGTRWSQTFTATTTLSNLTFRPGVFSGTISRIQVEEGSTATDYEPYEP